MNCEVNLLGLFLSVNINRQPLIVFITGKAVFLLLVRSKNMGIFWNLCFFYIMRPEA